MKLYYSHNLNPRVAVAVARYLEAPLEYIRADPMHPDNREAFQPINPNTRVPVLVEDGRAPLWETDAIACRLSALAGSTFWRVGEAQPDMIRWISWGMDFLTRPANPAYFSRVVMPTFTDERLPDAQVEDGIIEWRENLPVLEAHLAGREWVLDDGVSYADFRAATALPFAEAAGLPLDDAPNVRRWKMQLEAIDAWRDPFAGLD